MGPGPRALVLASAVVGHVQPRGCRAEMSMYKLNLDSSTSKNDPGFSYIMQTGFYFIL